VKKKEVNRLTSYSSLIHIFFQRFWGIECGSKREGTTPITTLASSPMPKKEMTMKGKSGNKEKKERKKSAGHRKIPFKK